MTLARKSLAVFLAAFVCLAAVVIFTPLHKHQDGKCSLNNLESCQPDQVAVEILVPTPRIGDLFEVSAPKAVLRAAEMLALPARAPPALALA